MHADTDEKAHSNDAADDYSDDTWRACGEAFNRLAELCDTARDHALANLGLSERVADGAHRLLQCSRRVDGILDRPLLSTSAAGNLVGRTLADWSIEELIGRGGSCVVFRAIDRSGRAAAIKVPTIATVAIDGGARLLQEARILRELDHPLIARIMDSGTFSDGTPWIATSFVDGVSVAEWADHGQVTEVEIVRCIIDVCEATTHCHGRGVIHRDIKPSNVLIDTQGRIQLLDFGISVAVLAEWPNSTSSWEALTPQYAAPEQFESAPITPAADVFGIGALAFRLLTGSPPRDPPCDPGTLISPPSHAIRESRNAQLGLRSMTLAGNFDNVIGRALSHLPEERPPTPQCLALELLDCLSEAA